MLPRVLEPEVMDTADEAADYDAMDHADVNARFCEDLLSEHPELAPPVLDVGTGTALIPIELCARTDLAEIVAIDMASHMLARARENVARAGLVARVRLESADAKDMPFPDEAFSATVSNSLVHHIPEPAVALREMWRVTARGGRIFVRDLVRPRTIAEVDYLVDRYMGPPPSERGSKPLYARQRALLRASLCAALTVEEVVAMVSAFGIPAAAVAMTSDRHWTLSHVKG